MCQRPITVVNPHYKKLAREGRSDLREFVSRKDYWLSVPCGHCVECLKKRQQQWFLRADHVFHRANLRPEDCLFCTFTLKPEVYEEAKEKPYLVVRRFIDRLRKHPRFRYRDPESKRWKYRKVKFPYLFVIEFADGKRAEQRGLPSTHRMHFHAVLFGCPLYWWQVRDLWESHNGRAWVEPMESMAAVRYVTKYMFKDNKVEQKLSKIDARNNGKLIVSHGFGRLNKEDLKTMRSQMLLSRSSWFCVFIGNFRYSIPRYWKKACFTDREIRERNYELVPPLIWDAIRREKPGWPVQMQKALYYSKVKYFYGTYVPDPLQEQAVKR